MGGCMSGTTGERRPAIGSIVDLVRKIKLTCEQQQLKKLKILDEQELILLQMLNKEVPQRMARTEQTIINRTVYTKNIIQMYLIVEMECKKILDYKQSIEMNLDLVTSSLQIVVYSGSMLKEELIAQLDMTLRTQYPNFHYPVDADIKQDLLRHHKKTEEVTFQMENEYIMEFSSKYNLEMKRICAPGHKYRYGATSPQ